MEGDDRSDSRRKFIPASPALVFAAMSDPARIARWWGPAGFTNTIHEFEFAPGGTWLLTMHGPDGTNYPNESRFTRIEADRLFEIEHLTGHHFFLTIELEPRDGGTEVKWRQTFDTAQHYERIAEFVAAANEQNLERLAAEVGRGSSKLIAVMSMSLDGYVADRDDGVAEVFDWYMASGNVEFHTGGSDPMTFHVSEPSAHHLRTLWSELGAVLTGRRTFDKAAGWNGNHAWGPAFVLTHEIPAGWPRPGSTVHFVTDGLESAVSQAKAAAKGKSVAVHGADTIQQLLNAGLLDELSIDVASLLLGSGVRLFDRLAGTPSVLGNPTVIPGVGVTHLRYPVHKAAVG